MGNYGSGSVATAVAMRVATTHPWRMDELQCPWCQDLIGMYEPMVVITSAGEVLRGSRLTLEAALGDAGSLAAHAGCHSPGGGSVARPNGLPLPPSL